MNNPTNQEIVMLQNIDRQFNSVPPLQNICKAIGSKYQNPRLSQFLGELFPSLYGQTPETIHRAIKILLELIQKENDVQMIDTDLQKELLTYTQYEYTDVLCAFFEKSLTTSQEEGQKHKSYVYNKRILSEAWERDPNPLVNQIKEKLDQAYQESETWQDFEENLVSSLDENEQVYFSNITTQFQNKPLPKRQQSQYDRMRALMPDRLQQKLECGQHELTKLRMNMKDQKESFDNISRVHALDFYLKLYDLMQNSYLTLQSEKIKKNELQKLLQDLQSEVLKKEADLIQMKYVKYFYKNLKFKRLNGDRRVSFDNHMSIRAKLTEFIREDLKNAVWPRKCKPPIIGKNWKQTYEELYREFSKLNAEEAEQYFGIITTVQNTIVQYLKFRWNYLYLFYNLIVETTYHQQKLDQIIDQAFSLMWNTKKSELKLTFQDIVRKLGVTQIQNQPYEYSGCMYLENQLLYIHNKIIKMYLKIYRYDGHNLWLHQDIVKFEVNLIAIFNDNLIKEKEQITRILDSVLTGDKEDKETKMEFYLSYFNYFTSKLSQIYVPNVSLVKKRNYALSPCTLKEDYTKKICPYQEVLAREENQMDRVRFIIRYKLQFLRYQDAPIEILLNAFVEYFLNDNVFVFYLPTLYRSLFYFSKQKKALSEIYAEIEKIRFLSVAYKNDEVEPFILSNFKQEKQKSEIAEADPQRYTFEKIYNYSQKIYNYYVQYQQYVEQWTDPLPRSNNLQELNTFHYNLMCFIPCRIFFYIKSEKQFYEELPKLQEWIKVKQSIEPFHNQDQFILQVNEFKQYKSTLIKEAANNSEKFKEKLVDCFQKIYLKGRLITEIIYFKQEYKIALNEFELVYQSKRYWNSQINAEIKQSQDQKGRLEELQKRLGLIQTIQQFKQELLRIKDINSDADPFLQNFIRKYFDLYISNIDPPISKTRHTRGHILNQNIINKKIQTLRETKYKEIQIEDVQLIAFISEQFENFMKNMIGKVLQATLVQKVGNEIKMYQNKTLTQDQQQKCKHLIDMQKLYGPQKDTNLDMVLYNPPQQSHYFNYELCDFTPTQRLSEFRRLMIETEFKQDEILQNKIRQSKWREEHPELNDILSKKVKRGTELWSYVSEFLSNRKKKTTNQEEEEAEQEKIKQQVEQVDLRQLKQELQLKLKESEKQQQQISTRQQYTKLLNLEKDNHLQTKKDVTTRTVQYVLENMPYYKKSHILYKSYIL